MAQSRYEKLKPLLGPGEKALVLIRPDPDSLSSAWSLKLIFQKNKSKADIAIYDPIKRLENRTMVRELHIPLKDFNASMLESYSRLCLVDAQPNQYPDLDLDKWEICH